MIDKYLQQINDPNVITVLKILADNFQQMQVDLNENILDTGKLERAMNKVMATNTDQDNDLEDLRRAISALETKVFYGDDY